MGLEEAEAEAMFASGVVANIIYAPKQNIFVCAAEIARNATVNWELDLLIANVLVLWLKRDTD